MANRFIFQKRFTQEHFEDKCFLPFPNVYANSSMGRSLKAEEKALGKEGFKDSGEKIVPLLSQHEDVHI